MIQHLEQYLENFRIEVPERINVESARLMGHVMTAAEAIEKIAAEIGSIQASMSEKNDSMKQTHELLGLKITE
jgi:hypothetical protein